MLEDMLCVSNVEKGNREVVFVHMGRNLGLGGSKRRSRGRRSKKRIKM